MGARDVREWEAIVVLLLSLAATAARAAAVALPARWLALSILRRAEAVALAHVAGRRRGMPHQRPMPLPDRLADGFEPQDATRLSRRLGALAGAILAMLSAAVRPGRARRAPAGALAVPRPVAAGRPHDTS